ncbi:unnamed protein product [Didymodactylos carnosus]|uniref:B30.2/SPRY domain-containing protein n=1 Tax=Didymodactylos carnosus TaxID=1234261 RepID=A0A815VN41_9BILA|nr:unnamed protein product [Didymodactylos carnosus]CAF1532566.1 unnamed protein product [Didymodactylos carnosus]CAF4079693.1 unnamed protein product [Didymodactylos carnosus]CAF4391943.1 unnamed protein product [Didymodactylos carnosus]
MYEHDMLLQQIRKSELDQELLFITQINQWEQDSIRIIQQATDKVRKYIQQKFDNNRNQINKIENELRLKRGIDDDHSEINIQQLIEQLKQLSSNIEINTPSINVINVRSISNIVAINSNEKFDQVHCNDIRIEENGLVAAHSNDKLEYCEVRGKNLYSTDIHRIKFTIEKMSNSNWIFIGIISQSTPLQSLSHSSPSFHGWTAGNRICLNSFDNENYGGYHDCKINNNDLIELLINCSNKKIQLLNKNTNRTNEIQVDIQKCPFPWQLHLNLVHYDDRVRLL